MLDQLAAIGASFNVLPHIGALTVAYLLALPIGIVKKANAAQDCGPSPWSPLRLVVSYRPQRASPRAAPKPQPGSSKGSSLAWASLGVVPYLCSKEACAEQRQQQVFGPQAQLGRRSDWVPMTLPSCSASQPFSHCVFSDKQTMMRETVPIVEGHFDQHAACAGYC